MLPGWPMHAAAYQIGAFLNSCFQGTLVCLDIERLLVKQFMGMTSSAGKKKHPKESCGQ